MLVVVAQVAKEKIEKKRLAGAEGPNDGEDGDGHIFRDVLQDKLQLSFVKLESVAGVIH